MPAETKPTAIGSMEQWADLVAPGAREDFRREARLHDAIRAELLAALEALLATAIRPTRLHGESASEYQIANDLYDMAVRQSYAAIEKTRGQS